MDKNALLAISLSIAVIIFWDAFIMKKISPPKKHHEKKIAGSKKPVADKVKLAKEEVEKVVPDTVSVNFDVASEGMNKKVLAHIKKTQATKEERKIIVDTKLYEAVFSNKGGVLVSWKVKNYKDGDKNPLQLVSNFSAASKDFPLSIVFKDKNRTNIINSQIADVSTDNSLIKLSDSTPAASLSFSFLDPYGARVEKVFTFHNESYLLDVDVIQKNVSRKTIDKSFSLKWSRGIGTGTEKLSTTDLVNTSISMWKDGALENEKVEDIKETIEHKGHFDWVVAESTYFASFIVPPSPSSTISIIREGEEPFNVSFLVSSDGDSNLVANAEKKDSFAVYVGPKALPFLEYPAKNFENVMDYGWFAFIAKPLMDVLRFTSDYINSYGWSIVILTVLIKLIFYPMTQTSYRSMGAMQKLQPKIAELKEKYKADPQRLQKETMSMYKTHKVNPLGGCLPMVIQIPVFFALYKVLLIAIELRSTPFLWITDLAAPDPVTTILMGVSMLVQQITTPSAGDPKQQKMMLILPVIFTFMFWSFPAGLVLYWFINNVLTIFQQMSVKKEGEAAAASGSKCPVKR